MNQRAEVTLTALVMLVMLLASPLVIILGGQSAAAPPIGITFDRQLSGDRVGQHKAPPFTPVTIIITATVLSPIDNGVLIDYFPNEWFMVDAKGGAVSVHDENYNKVEWNVDGVSNSVSRSYVVRSPQLTSPPTKYYFHSELTYSGGSAVSDDWMVIVADLPDTETLRPNADGYSVQWSISDSTHYGATSDQSDTTYVYSTTEGQKEFLNLNDPTLGDSDTINSIQVYYRCRSVGGSATPEKIDLYIRSDGTDTQTDPNIAVSRTAFTNIAGTPQTTNPTTGNPWTKSEVTTLQAGMIVDSVGAGEEIRSSEIWVVVDYTPAAVPPGKPALYLPADGTVTNDNTPTFEWTVGSDADNHCLLVDNDADLSSPEENVLLGGTDNNYTPTAELADENYSWKVIAINAVGENESTVWTFTIDTVQPGVPALASPADGTITNDNTPTFEWSTVSDPSGITYTLKVDNDPDFTSPEVNVLALTENSYTPSVLADENYSWRVRAVDGANNAGDWSTIWTLLIDTTSPQVTLVSPPDGAKTNDNTPTFTWNSVNDPSGVTYTIQVDNDADFTSPEVNVSGLINNSYTPSALADENYSWHVRAVDGIGNSGDWSTVWTLLIDTVAPPPPSSSPDDGLVANDNTPALDWTSVVDTSGSATGEAAGVANYEIWIDNDSNFTDIPLKDNSTTSSYTLVHELVDENYTFKVRAWDKAGNVGEWSDNWTFFVDTTDFLVSASSTALELLRGDSASVEVSAMLTQGESENVNWSYGWDGTPPVGVTDNFNPENIAMPCSFDLIFNTQAGADTGEFVYHITGTSVDPEDKIGVTEKSRTVDITLTVAGMIFSINAYPRELKLMRSDTVSSTISVEFLFGSRENVNLSGGWVSTDPGISYNLEPSSNTPPFDSTLTLKSSEDTTAGSYTFRVTAYGGGITRIVDIPVDVVVALTSTLNADEQSYKRGQEIHISGEVVDPKENPVRNGTAMITLSCGGWSEDIISTIANGMYSADYLIAPDDPGGEWTIAVDAEDNRGNVTLTSEKITVNVTTDLTVTAATDASSYEKGQKIRISGTVDDPKGNPVENGEATITLKSGNWTDQLVTRITDGTYVENYYITFDKPEGDWTITVTAVDGHGNLGQAPENIGISVSIPASWEYYTITFLSPVPGTVCSRGSEVTVTVQITGSPEKISGADVYLATPSGDIITLTEGSPGIYSTAYVPRWDDPVGEWTVSVLGEKTVQDVYKAGTSSTSLGIAPADLELELLEPSHRTFEVGEEVDVKVRVSYPDGSPVDGAIVIADLSNGENLTLLNEGEGVYRGAYSVGGKDLGAWGLTVSAVDAYSNSGASSEVTLSVKELSPSSYPIRYWWITIPVILACALVPLPVVVKKLRIRKLKSIKSKISATKKLRKELPKRYFMKGAISREIYDSLMHQTMEKLMKLKKEARRLQGKLEKRK